MERTTFLEHYCISLSSEGAPQELNRTGAAITYKAIDERSGDAVALTLIPITPLRLEEKKERKDHFFATVIQEGLLLASEN